MIAAAAAAVVEAAACCCNIDDEEFTGKVAGLDVRPISICWRLPTPVTPSL
jgi:hypothetical protein